MNVTESLLMMALGFVVIPVSVETSICMNPKVDQIGAVCQWREDTWERKFHKPSLTYYMALKKVDKTDNFIESNMRVRYHKKLDKKLEQWTSNPQERRLEYLKQIKKGANDGTSKSNRDI
tara:strand:- start:1011 stop:1370 length:360 start_codon:yes stop_codon:yes gene_type:complete